ncbi:sigma-54-dependent transcriptional regulator [Thermodesulforhabdus norvegica]|uniref:Two component, sigma54 specific, transcriptional regulator, Fis family n=1 Tax=Thermodesulforhabdus norvegica TaxID=39841 RepID=A0A1I4TY98_9BACT|nr:sigma-54 dependent transcriptional regulator [Thermodesulforhabdus norvegica]SFM81550.1 two component, sigma54 specific, transcriptional regulator, Fis family [Thermodesulforhabdus norvegica]
MAHVLIVDDEPFICENLQRILEEENYRTQLAFDGQSALKLVEKESPDLVLLDLRLPDMNGLDVLRTIKEMDPEIFVIIITGYASVESAVQAIKLGAYDYIKKPFKADVIKLIVRLALEAQGLRKEVNYLREHKSRFHDEIVYRSETFSRVLGQAREVARHGDTTVLIMGESGTGKEVIARYIHAMSPRKNKPFMAVNCAAFPGSLLESEIFGHEKGAFTGAVQKRAGLFEAASGGTLFLDEVAEMDLNVQAKLLRVLEEKKVRRLGSTRLYDVDVRIIAATNKDLQKAVRDGRFREDLFYRLNVFPIVIPPLRERPEDIMALAEFFMKHYARKFGKDFQKIGSDAEELLTGYSWPGNVRELKNTMERICIMHNSDTLRKDHLPAELLPSRVKDDLQAAVINIPFPEEGLRLDDILDQVAASLISEAVKRAGGNISLAARLLGIPRGTLRYKLDKYGITLN